MVDGCSPSDFTVLERCPACRTEFGSEAIADCPGCGRSLRGRLAAAVCLGRRKDLGVVAGRRPLV